MGTVYQKKVTRPMPPDAEIITRKGQRIARWKRNGKTRMAPVIVARDGAERIADTAGTYTAKYRDGNGIVIECSTGCRDHDAARCVLAGLERRAELVKAGVMTADENAVADHQAVPLAEHFDAYAGYLVAQGVSKRHPQDVRRKLDRLAAECSLSKLADLGRDSLERWLVAQTKANMGARTRNTYRAAAVAFGNWCVDTRRLVVNPFAGVRVADERSDCRRQRRALTEAGLVRLLDVAHRRPLIHALTIHRGKRKGQLAANIRDCVRQQLARLGRERALIYKTLVLTGLRRGELASITIGQLDLDGPLPSIVLDAADEKNRAGSTLPLRSDLAADLALWVKELAESDNGNSGASEGRLCLPLTTAPLCDTLPADTPLFNVPDKLVKILDRDLRMAGIAKRDERGRTVDVHAMRHTFGSLLSKGGVAPRTAQAAMRHAKIDLTMNVYTDPKVLDVAGALDALPTLPLVAASDDRQEQRATGTYERNINESTPPFSVAPLVAPTLGQRGKTRSLSVKRHDNCPVNSDPASVDVNPYSVNENNPLTFAVNGWTNVETSGVEPPTPGLQKKPDRPRRPARTH